MPSIHAFVPPAPTRPPPISHSDKTSTPKEIKTYKSRLSDHKPTTYTRTPARSSPSCTSVSPAPNPGRRDSSSIDWPSHSPRTDQRREMYRSKTAAVLVEPSSSSQRSEGSSTSGLSSAPVSVSPEKRRKAIKVDQKAGDQDEDDGEDNEEEEGEGEEWEEDMMIDTVDDDDGDSDYRGNDSVKKGNMNGNGGRVLRDRRRSDTEVERDSGGMGGDTANQADKDEAEAEMGEEEEEEEEEWSEDEIEMQTILHVEVRLTSLDSPHNPRPQGEWMLQKLIREAIYGQLGQTFAPDTPLNLDKLGNEILLRNVERVFIAESEPYFEQVDFSSVEMRFYFYRASEIRDLEQLTAVTEDDDEAAAVPAASIRSLPSPALEGIWENLVYDTDLKPRLLRYIDSTMAFSAADIDFNKVSWNRLVLLHGPPGTGKTSLCRALSQKLLVRMGNLYESGKLVEINSHSLFSKWFSESGKLVQKLFSSVGDMMKDPRCLVVVMIDEVESLTAARSAAINGSEPSDALRVVNALLTQLDKLKTQPNVLVMTTSNIPDTIDSAFIDRADEKFFVDYPPPEAVYWILKGCLEELAIRGMMRPVQLPKWRMANMFATLRNENTSDGGQTAGKATKRLRGEERVEMAGARLCEIAKKCHDANLAGRFLRRLPLLAHSRYLSPTSRTTDDGQPIPRSIEKWLEGFERAVNDEIGNRERIAVKTVTKLGKEADGGETSGKGVNGQVG